MKSARYKKYLETQKKDMEKYKWLESEKAGRNLGEVAILDWIKKYAKPYRKKWVMHDLELALRELKIIKRKAKTSRKGKKFLRFILDILEKTEEALELLETNGNGGKA